MSVLTIIILAPIVAAFLLFVAPVFNGAAARRLAQIVSASIALVSLWLFYGFDAASADLNGFKYALDIPWIPTLGIHYYVGLDGLNLGLLLMTALVLFAAVCFTSKDIKEPRLFYGLTLLMGAGVLGAFASLDIFFFYFFHELALVPTFIMIGRWGRGPDPGKAAYHITLYLSVGALLTLVGLIALYVASGASSFSIPELMATLESNPIDSVSQKIIFPLLMVGFGILVSLWPLHTWAPLGYGTAPAPTAMLHAGALKKFGLYGLIRIAAPMVPEGAAVWLGVLGYLCLGNLLYVGLVALRQKDLNGLIAHSSVAHMGFVFLGIASFTLIGVTGAVLVMVAHGLLAALFFGLSGRLYEQGKSLDMESMGGILRSSPRLGFALLIAFLAGCGVPGFANFAGEFTVLIGAWNSNSWIVVGAAWAGLVIGAVYMFRAIRYILHGERNDVWSGITDLKGSSLLASVVLMGALFVFGVAPQTLTKEIEKSVSGLVEVVDLQTEGLGAVAELRDASEKE